MKTRLPRRRRLHPRVQILSVPQDRGEFVVMQRSGAWTIHWLAGVCLVGMLSRHPLLVRIRLQHLRELMWIGMVPLSLGLAVHVIKEDCDMILVVDGWRTNTAARRSRAETKAEDEILSIKACGVDI